MPGYEVALRGRQGVRAASDQMQVAALSGESVGAREADAFGTAGDKYGFFA